MGESQLDKEGLPSKESQLLDKELEGLRSKYSQPGYREQLLAKENSAAPKKTSTPAEDSLSRIRICASCQAMGYVTKHYGFRVLQESCPDCGGEGLIGTKQPAEELKVEHARRQRITQLEAAIASVESLEELEKLEAELRLLQPAPEAA